MPLKCGFVIYLSLIMCRIRIFNILALVAALAFGFIAVPARGERLAAGTIIPGLHPIRC